MDLIIGFLNLVSYVTTVIVVVTIIVSIIVWAKGILPALFRLGNGLAKRKIAIFAKGDELRSLEHLLVDSKLFKQKNVIDISSDGDFGRAESATLFLVFWPDWQNKITEILNSKKDNTMLVVYAPQDQGFIPSDKMKELNSKRNVIVVNLRGRLLNDIVTSLISTSYQ